MCQLLGVSRSGYYEWLSRSPCAPAAADQALQATITRYFAQGRGTYGTRRIKHLLAQDGLQVSHRRIGRVLAQAGLRCKTRRKCKAPRVSEQAQTVAPNQRNREDTLLEIAPRFPYAVESPGSWVTVGHSVSTRRGYCYCIGFTRFWSLPRQHMRGTIFGMWGMTNSIRPLLAQSKGRGIHHKKMYRNLF